MSAVYVGLRHMHDPFMDMQRFVVAVGGDVDTIGAMAGAIWGAANGVSRLPEQHLARLEQRDRIVSVARGLQAPLVG